jgi:glycerol-3-phosphate dehydrogenase
LSNSPYDLLVIGGGIYGAWIAWDAALRGLSVALVDKGDFASATSSNSLKIIHGGFRYLQHADFRRMRQSIRERRDLMKVAPHLVHPLPVLIPSYGSWMQRKELMALALAMNDLMAMDRNRLQDPQKHITRGRVLSRQEVERLVPDVPSEGLSGGLVFHDAQVYSSERLVISVLRSAAGAGAALDNYVEVTSLLKDGNSVAGVVAHDVLTGDRFEVRARMTVNATGPWSERLLGLLGEHYQNDTTPAVKAVNLVTRRLVEGYAVGVASANGYRDADALISRSDKFLFIAPWRGYSLIGTTYTSFDGHPDRLEVTPGDVEDLLQKFNRAWPSARLGFDDVSLFTAVCCRAGGAAPPPSMCSSPNTPRSETTAERASRG